MEVFFDMNTGSIMVPGKVPRNLYGDAEFIVKLQVGWMGGWFLAVWGLLWYAVV